MPSVPYNRIAPVDEIRVGQTLVHENWREDRISFYRILDIAQHGTGHRVRLVDNYNIESTHRLSSFGSPSNWVLIEDENFIRNGITPITKGCRRPKSGFGLFIKKLEEEDANRTV